MKRWLRGWLLKDAKEELQLAMERAIMRRNVDMVYEKVADLLERIPQIEADLNETRAIVGALLDHLKLGRIKVMEPDPAYMPPEPRMHEVIRITKSK